MFFLKVLFVFICSVTVLEGATPTEVKCPKEPLIRHAKNDLCSKEEQYIKNKEQFNRNKYREFLESLDVFNFDNSTLDSIVVSTPRLGVAISGGGYRSMLTSLGFLLQMEKWGLYDMVDYISGLSGGSWTLMGLILNDFDPKLTLDKWNFADDLLKGVPEFDITSADIVSGMHSALQKRNSQRDSNFSSFEELMDYLEVVLSSLESTPDMMVFQKRSESPLQKLKQLFFPNDTFSSPHILDTFKNFREILEFYIDLHLDVRPKKVQGFPVTFTDYWGRALINRARKRGLSDENSTSLSTLISSNDRFQKYEAPIPIFVSNCKNGFLKNVIFEFTPFEFGSWEAIGRLFVKLEFLGSRIVAGKAKKCFRNFDDIGFITGTSSSIFNNAIIYMWQKVSQSSHEALRALKVLLSVFGLNGSKVSRTIDEAGLNFKTETDYAVYQHNPFYKYPHKENILTSEDYLYLVDGGEDGENIPLRSILISERNLDVIFMIDSSSDIDNYANGTKLKNIFEQLKEKNVEYRFPSHYITLASSPIIIGCEPVYHNNGELLPILIYYANMQHTYPSNMSTFKVSYEEDEIEGIVNNGRNIFSRDNSNYFRNCLGCILLKRSNITIPLNKASKFCSSCYKNLCYS
ncbi:hypothetical protein KAFR_0H03190 [Kazachstania africana CBS 2517]|uniref:Lysophospholipase n=1 Tax=Kazachstania africana (strain ATCC 22294 / BCRC 22015 / CBS 2517 / CECT 1963 / NBRC 1671 / NRRL Y-8276) TaxID=1071382 RepID=H2AZH3_KAZAF|nr:hypothetical protein KAFR_0H03190 [Kazachstania africana CBS 2517]CCF59729.1 hypothetical protein KAFR_0H03190 [Kazachstania africana CBS 2517]